MAAIGRDLEWRRIASLPRRPTPDPYPWQPALRGDQPYILGAMAEGATQQRGAAIQVPVGGGKTLPSLLAPVVYRAQHHRLVVFPHLCEKTLREAEYYRSLGYVFPAPNVVTFSDLSLKRRFGAAFPDDLDLIVIDEGQALRNYNSGRTRRLAEYLERNPQTKVVVLSATLFTQSVREQFDLLDMALRDRSPCPRTYHAAQYWAAALDATEHPGERPHPGALLSWPGAVGADALEQGRAAYARRVAETPGVFVSTATQVDVPLYFRPWDAGEMPTAVASALEDLRQTWVRPDGHQLILATEFAVAAKALALGFYHYWEERPPESWLDARAAYGELVKYHLKWGRYATEGDVAAAMPDAKAVLDWRHEHQAWKPTPRIAWVSDHYVQRAAAWVRDRPERLVWVHTPALGHAVAEAAGAEYYGRGTQRGEELEKGTGPAVASQIHGTGRNLQRFCQMLLLQPPAKSANLTQIIGRCHRQGQTECVYVEASMHTPETCAPWERTIEEAVRLEVAGRQPQKLLRAILPQER